MSDDRRLDRYAAFSCPSCKVKFQLIAAQNSWDEELQYDFACWLRLCIDERAVKRALPGACARLSSYFELLHATDGPFNRVERAIRDEDTPREIE